MHPFDPVLFTTDAYRSEGAPLGTTGVVIDDYPNGHKLVEVANIATGETLALAMAEESHLAVVRSSP